MFESTLTTPRLLHASAQKRRASRGLSLWFALMLALSGLVILVLLRSRPDPSVLAWLLYIFGAAAIIREPRHGVYLVLFLSLIGDATLTPWYPFVKNFSSRESLLFVSDALIVNPLEGYLVLTSLAWLARGAVQRKITFVKGPLLLPVLLLATFVIAGLVYGLSRGGNTNVALWEARPLLYLPLMFVLATHLLQERVHVSNMLWFLAAALFLEGISGVVYVFGTLNGELSGVQAITEHAAAVHMNTLYILTIAAWLYSKSYAKRLVLPVFLVPVLVTYIATQRRAAFVALAVALLLLIIVALHDRRKTLLLALPPVMIAALAYLLAFWSVDSALGVPAQAIKSVIAPQTLSATDQASNLYRLLENINIQFTIHAAPWRGIGFGQKFYHVVMLPNISWFVWWEYITHNSILWLWMKMGVAGFLAALYLAGAALVQGGASLRRLPAGELKVGVLVATLYICMHFVYAYVDMGWDIQSTLFLGIALGIIDATPRLMARPEPASTRLWPWQEPSGAHSNQGAAGE